jgi:hypothetical protein
MHFVLAILVVIAGLFSLQGVQGGYLPEHGYFKRDAIEGECGIGHFGGVFSSILLILNANESLRCR